MLEACYCNMVVWLENSKLCMRLDSYQVLSTSILMQLFFIHKIEASLFIVLRLLMHYVCES